MVTDGIQKDWKWCTDMINNVVPSDNAGDYWYQVLTDTRRQHYTNSTSGVVDADIRSQIRSLPSHNQCNPTATQLASPGGAVN